MLVCVLLTVLTSVKGQPDTLILGFGGSNIITTASSSTITGSQNNTVSEVGFLPNENAASRFLSHATLGHNQQDIQQVMTMGVEDWISNQLTIPRSFTLESRIRLYHKMVKLH